MNLKFNNKKISGILTVLPENELNFEDELENYSFSREKSMKLKMIMGYGKHRIVENGVCTSDICIFGLNYLFDNKLLKREEIDALILVTQSPDHFMPPTSNIIQGKLGLKQDIICMDINQGCTGFMIGLFQAFMLLEQEEINKVVLLNADILSQKTSKRDRNYYPQVGDGATVTIVEKSVHNNTIYCNVKVDGTRADTLIIPAGGFRIPSTKETSEMVKDDNGNYRALDHVVMEGDKIFNFIQHDVPPLVEDLLHMANIHKEEVDYYMFHQPNKFILNKLASKLGVQAEKMPSNIVEKYGNASGATIPTVISDFLGIRLTTETFKICCAAFGVGLCWSSMYMEMGKMDFCQIIEF